MPDPGKENPHRTTFDNQLIELESVDSTNNYAMGRIHAGLASDGLVCLAHNQWAGKGQRGKSWVSEPGSNLIMSLVIEPSPLKLTRQFLFSAAVALGILETLRSVKTDGWRVKWPNDIYYNDRKAAGILIENSLKGQDWLFAVVGIGLNLNQVSFPDFLPNAISLKQITGNSYESKEIARLLVPSIQNQISILHKDPEAILQNYNLNLYKINQPVSLKKGKDMVLTRISSVDDRGMLVTEAGSFGWGEVEMVIDY